MYILEWQCEAVFPIELDSFCLMSTCPNDVAHDSVPNENSVCSMIHCEKKNTKNRDEKQSWI